MAARIGGDYIDDVDNVFDAQIFLIRGPSERASLQSKVSHQSRYIRLRCRVDLFDGHGEVPRVQVLFKLICLPGGADKSDDNIMTGGWDALFLHQSFTVTYIPAYP